MIVISPSGNWYGSEQVLYGHLQHTTQKYLIYVPRTGPFKEKLLELEHHTKTFGSTSLLYIRVFLRLLFGATGLYVNEGGHIRYVNLLASIFKNKRFVVHVRLVEDTSAKRIRAIKPNVYFVCVSEFIRGLVAQSFGNHENVQTIHDYVLKPEVEKEYRPVNDGVIRVGVVGRVCKHKGVLKAVELAKAMSKSTGHTFAFSFYGGVIDDEDVRQFRSEMEKIERVEYAFHGFVMDQNEIYDHVDCIVHFNAYEPFPRIYFEAVCNLKPIIGFNSGGVGEQADIMGFKDFLVDPKEGWATKMTELIQETKSSYSSLRARLIESWSVFDTKLDIATYVNRVEGLFLRSN